VHRIQFIENKKKNKSLRRRNVSFSLWVAAWIQLEPAQIPHQYQRTVADMRSAKHKLSA
jgi:hypothetical protein